MADQTSLQIPQIGIADIDQQHARLIDEFERLSYWTGKGHDFAAAIDALDRLADYVTTHFTYEEEMLRRHAYPQLVQHQLLHRYFREELERLAQGLREGDAEAAELLELLRHWIVDHIGGADVAYATYLRACPESVSEPSLSTSDAMASPPADTMAVQQPLDIEVVISAHKAWRMRLEWAIDGIYDDIPNVEKVGDDMACVLGRWLYSTAEGQYPSTQRDQLIAVHRQFHELAAEVLRLSQQGQSDEAAQLLQGEFSVASSEVVKQLQQLRKIA